MKNSLGITARLIISFSSTGLLTPSKRSRAKYTSEQERGTFDPVRIRSNEICKFSLGR